MDDKEFADFNMNEYDIDIIKFDIVSKNDKIF